MRETAALIHALKGCLKAHDLTYKDVANHLELSEASVKRLFSQQDLTLERLEQILSLMDMRLIDLLNILEAESEYISQLTTEQENSLIQAPKLLLIFFMLLNAWPLSEICGHFEINEHELIQLLAKLDRLRLIELLPNNKVKLLTASNFTWRSHGPVQQFFEEQVLAEYFKHKFDAQSSKLIFLGGMLSDASLEKLKRLYQDFAQTIHLMLQEDRKLPLDKRDGVGIVLALRKWELSIFSKLRRNKHD